MAEGRREKWGIRHVFTWRGAKVPLKHELTPYSIHNASSKSQHLGLACSQTSQNHSNSRFFIFCLGIWLLVMFSLQCHASSVTMLVSLKHCSRWLSGCFARLAFWHVDTVRVIGFIHDLGVSTAPAYGHRCRCGVCKSASTIVRTLADW